MKPLGRKAYGSIGHLPNSRLGPGDHSVHQGQADICCVKLRDKHDEVLVQEKLDGSCCAVAKVDGQVLALGRAGYLATTSKYEMHKMFAWWVRQHDARFCELLDEGERVVGEWLAQAHSTRYNLPHEPFVPFDIMVGQKRLPYDSIRARLKHFNFVMPDLLHRGTPLSVSDAMRLLRPSVHGAVDSIEGLVYRVQRKGEVDFLAKYVRPDKRDGTFLPEVSGKSAVWNWGYRQGAEW